MDEKPKRKKVLKEGSVDGRPPVVVNWEQFNQLARIQCTMEEITAVMGIGRDSLVKYAKIDCNKTLSELYEEKRRDGKQSLRRAQWHTALGTPAVFDEERNMVREERKPNVTMQIFLGKNYLEQRDIWEHRGKDGAPLFPESPDAFKELDEICKEYGIDIRTNGKNGRKGKYIHATPEVQGHLPEGPDKVDS